MSFIDKAVDHIVKQLEQNNVATRDECEDEVRVAVKEGLARLEKDVFDGVVEDITSAEAAFPDLRGSAGADNIILYQGGAFGVRLFAPGGTMEVGVDGKPLPEELVRFRKRWQAGIGPCRVCGTVGHHPLLCPDLTITCKCGRETTQRHADEWCMPNPGEGANMMCPECNMSKPSSRIRRKLGEFKAG